MDIKKELDRRGITVFEAAEMFDIPENLLRSYLDGILEPPRIIRFGIEYAIGYRNGVYINHNEPTMIASLFGTLYTAVETKEAECQMCGDVVRLTVVKTIEGNFKTTAQNGIVWLDDFRYCGTCGPRALTSAMKRKDG